VSGFGALQGALFLLNDPREFIFDKAKILDGIQDKIVEAKVTSLQKTAKGYTIHADKSYQAKHVVLATPPEISKKLLDLPMTYEEIKIFIFHISGQLKKECKKDFQFFPPESSTCVIARQTNGSFIVAAHKQEALDEYFTDRFGIQVNGISGHCTVKGYKLLAENIANTILNEYFDRYNYFYDIHHN